MRWVHLSDIHVGRDGVTAQQTAVDSLVDALGTAVAGLPVDAVIISGDLSHAGKETQFTNLGSGLLANIRAIPACRSAAFFAVPGNHDLDCDLTLPTPWDSLGRHQSTFFEETDDTRKMRESRAKGFLPYSDFLRKNGVRGVDPLQAFTAWEVVQAASGSTLVVTVNTAFFCYMDYNSRERFPPPDTSLRATLRAAPQVDHVLVVGHHPIDWFSPSSRNLFRANLLSKNAIYLHGHAHELQVRFGSNGVESFGFGAAYVKPDYNNSFAVCELDKLLHVAPYHWDNLNGRWVPTTTLPPDFLTRSPRLTNGWALTHSQSATSTVLGIPAPQPTPKVLRFLPATHLTSQDWANFLVYARILPADVTTDLLVPTDSPPGEANFQYSLPGGSGKHYVRCLSGSGTHLSRSQVEDLNTQLDTEDYQSVTLITMGTMSDEAETVYLRLRTRKAIQVYTASDLGERLSSTSGFLAVLGGLDVALTDSEFSLADGGVPLLVVQEKLRQNWFYVVSPDGTQIGEADSRVASLRKTRPALASASYKTHLLHSEVTMSTAFDRQRYLDVCKREFSALKYAPLAAMGLRLPGISLDDLYVETGAQVGDEAASRQELTRALTDLVDSAQIDGVIREEMLQSSKSRLESPGLEHTTARALYQQYGSLVVLGDPGSGKTCFVKRELLAYCSAQGGSWYGRHSPIYVSLSELAAESSGDDPYELLDNAVQLSTRRGLDLATMHARDLFSRGQLAIFLDGLDEIVSLERRATTYSAIRKLLELGSPLGNRFVLTSRPAAVSRAEIPRTLSTIHMRGLTHTEMRALAERILAARVSESKGSLRLDVTQLTPGDHTILEQLLDDCRSEPGIGRLARNPLFLTLLVMIYANSGAPSAKRHRVYQQAVNTLVAIRARDAGQRGLSEADLRRRLGAVALSVFRDPRGALPSLDGVTRQIQAIMSEERGRAVERSEVDRYLQDVAEATGLLVFHRPLAPGQPGSVMFMHHSFLEYYAALGLSTVDFTGELPALSRVPRWHDVLTLLAGIVGDSGDIHPIVEALLLAPDLVSSITLDGTLLAMDCALESDIPPERVLRALLHRLADSIASGSLLYDPYLQEEVGERLARLIAGSGSQLISRFFVDGLGSDDDQTCAAYINILGHSSVEVSPHESVLQAFDLTAMRSATVVRMAVCSSAARATSLRSNNAISCIASSLDGAKPAQKAAARALIEAPSLGKTVFAKLAEVATSGTDEVAEMAARAVLKVGFPLDARDAAQTAALDVSLRKVADGGSPSASKNLALSYSRTDLEPLLRAEDKPRRIMGIGFLAWMVKDEVFVRDELMRYIQTGDREERVAALSSLRFNSRVQKILTSTHGEALKKLLRQGETRDVRLAAARVLGTIGSEEASVVRELVEFAKEVRGSDLFRYAVNVVSWCAERAEPAQAFLLDEAENQLFSGRSRSNDVTREILTVLDALDGVDSIASERLTGKLGSIVDDFHYDLGIRKRAVYAFAWVCDIEIGAKRFGKWLEQPPRGLFAAIARSVARFVGRCRKRLDYIRLVHGYLPDLQEGLTSYYSRGMAAVGSDGQAFVPSVRRAISDIRDMLNSFREYTRRQPGPTQMVLLDGGVRLQDGIKAREDDS